MPKEKHFMVTDTETVGLGHKAFVFDLGYVITSRKGTKLERSFLVREIITNPTIMLGALFNEEWRAMMGGKLFANYMPALNDGSMRIYPWSEIVETMREDMRTYDVQVFAAYNLPFDSKALAKTQQRIRGEGKILDYRPSLLCLWDFACSAVCNTQLYHDVAWQEGNERGWITDAGNVRTTAEKVYSFLTGQLDFIESHTALDDARIEAEILLRLLAKRKTIPYDNPDIGSPWQRAQAIRGRLFDF